MKQWKYYIAYGSNLNLMQMAKRCPDAKTVGTGLLEDYELQFRGRKDNAFATIEQKAGKQVPVLLWQISDRDEKRLDQYEGYPLFYGKQMVEVEIDKTIYHAMVYEMQPGMTCQMPSERYFNTILEGYMTLELPVAVLQEALRLSEEQIEMPKADQIEQQL